MGVVSIFGSKSKHVAIHGDTLQQQRANNTGFLQQSELYFRFLRRAVPLALRHAPQARDAAL